MCLIPFMAACAILAGIIEPHKSRHARGFKRPKAHHGRSTHGMTFKCFIYDGRRAVCSTIVNAENAEAAEVAAGFKFAAYFPNANFTRIAVYAA